MRPAKNNHDIMENALEIGPLARAERAEAEVERLLSALSQISYWANVNFEDSGEMGVAMDRIAEIAEAARRAIAGDSP